jgi:hypothetical protein
MAICALTNSSGYFQATTDVPYVCPVGKQAWIKTIVAVNEDAVGHWFEIRLNNGSVAVLISTVAQPIAAGARYSDTDQHAFYAGNQIEVIADAADLVSYFISVIEEPV